MDAFGKLFSTVSQAFEFNQATLSGCVDIVVVQQRDGSLKSTPFHVRLGKLKVLKSAGKEVRIHVNGFESDLKMKLGDAGEGFFEREKTVRHKNYSQELKSRAKAAISTLEAQSEAARTDIQQNKKLAHLLTMKHSLSNQTTSAVSKIDESQPNRTDTKNDVEVVFDHQIISEKENDSMAQEDKTHNVVIKALRPTSDQLKSLNLRLGMNTITYTIRTSLQGLQTMSGHIYYWPSDANIIISDIDGTITKTDFLGHVMPMVGKDWSQPGITPLYTNIKRNGYHILYLTARPIGQSNQTKEFLQSVYQDGKMLPHGPLFMSPDRTIPSIRRELISKRPEIFKMACLKDIRNLFPADHNPFHAGFGNRETDAIAYKSAGIPLDKVYIVNPQGHIHHHNSTVAKSYAIINTMIKEIFPGVVSNRQLMFPEDEGEAVPLEIKDKTQISANVLKVIG